MGVTSPTDTSRDFAGQVAVVTGGGTGLGLEISRGLAARGADVTILSRNAEHHGAFLEEGERAGWAVAAAALDVREGKDVQRVAGEVLERTGRVDVLVNNAAGNFVCPSERLSFNAWRAVLGIVLDGTFFCSREFGRAMIAGGGGRILNIVATYAWTGMPGVVHSASAKAGVLAMTKTLASEWARHGIRVNAIAPGPFHSEGAAGNLWPDEEWAERLRKSIPLGRFATADEIAEHCLYLLGPRSDWVTGECLVVDGGASLTPSWWNPGERLERKKREDG
jgi:NAD(P)-dependent dehydrogenase (short-subunit alcohol dehydrogenase family)